METIAVVGFLIVFAGIAIVAVRWGLQKQAAFAAGFANDPDYVVDGKDPTGWAILRTRNAAISAQLVLESVEGEDHGVTQKALFYRLRLGPVALARRLTFAMEKVGVPVAPNRGGGGLTLGDPAVDGRFTIGASDPRALGAVIVRPEVRAALQRIDAAVRVVRLDADGTLWIDVGVGELDPADARQALSLGRALAQALHDAA